MNGTASEEQARTEIGKRRETASRLEEARRMHEGQGRGSRFQFGEQSSGPMGCVAARVRTKSTRTTLRWAVGEMRRAEGEISPRYGTRVEGGLEDARVAIGSKLGRRSAKRGRYPRPSHSIAEGSTSRRSTKRGRNGTRVNLETGGIEGSGLIGSRQSFQPEARFGLRRLSGCKETHV